MDCRRPFRYQSIVALVTYKSTVVGFLLNLTFYLEITVKSWEFAEKVECLCTLHPISPDASILHDPSRCIIALFLLL